MRVNSYGMKYVIKIDASIENGVGIFSNLTWWSWEVFLPHYFLKSRMHIVVKYLVSFFSFIR